VNFLVSELVKLVERTIRSEHHRSPNRPIYLVGESFGGCLALAVAALTPDIDLVLILANPGKKLVSFKPSLLYLVFFTPIKSITRVGQADV
jgi:pimeloyl-ACP methyl ester carboxylesterase